MRGARKDILVSQPFDQDLGFKVSTGTKHLNAAIRQTIRQFVMQIVKRSAGVKIVPYILVLTFFMSLKNIQ